MTDIYFYVLVGMLTVVLVNVLLVKRMLQNHHDKTSEHGHGEADEGF